MDAATIVVLSIVVLGAALFILARLLKKPTLESLRLHYGERMLFDDDNCTIELQNGQETGEMADIFVRVTNQRILLAQRLGGRSGKHILRYVVRYEDGLAGGRTGAPEKAGYVTMKSEPGKLTVQENGTFRIEPVQSGIGVPSRILIKTGNIDHYRELFRL